MNTKIEINIRVNKEDEVLSLAYFFELAAGNLKAAQADPTQDPRDLLEDCEVLTFSEKDFEDMYSQITVYNSEPDGGPEGWLNISYISVPFTPCLMVFWANGEQAAIGYRMDGEDKVYELNM